MTSSPAASSRTPVTTTERMIRNYFGVATATVEAFPFFLCMRCVDFVRVQKACLRGEPRIVKSICCSDVCGERCFLL